MTPAWSDRPPLAIRVSVGALTIDEAVYQLRAAGLLGEVDQQ